MEKRNQQNKVGVFGNIFGIISAFGVGLWAIVTLPFSFRLKAPEELPSPRVPPESVAPLTDQDFAALDAYEPARDRLLPVEEGPGILTAQKAGIEVNPKQKEQEIDTGLDVDINTDPAWNFLPGNSWHVDDPTSSTGLDRDINTDPSFDSLFSNVWHHDDSE